MMACDAKLNIDGLEYDLIVYEYEISKPVNAYGQAAGLPQGNIIHFSMLSPDNSNLMFHAWMSDKTLFKKGCITFSLVKDAMKSVKTTHFKNARCISLREHFEKHSDNEMLMHVTLFAETIKSGPDDDETDDRHEVEAVHSGNTHETEAAPEIAAVYWKDADGKQQIECLPANQEVSLYLQADNAPGEEAVFVIDLPDNKQLEISGQTNADGELCLPVDLSKYCPDTRDRNFKLHARLKWHGTHLSGPGINHKTTCCTLQFRRPKNYHGAFGFDWLRTGDTGDPLDKDYRHIMGEATGYTPAQQYQHLISHAYTSFDQEWKKGHPKYANNSKYIVPWATLLPGNTARFRLKLEVEELGDDRKIQLRFNNQAQTALEITGEPEITLSRAGTYFYEQELNIKCRQAFHENMALEAYLDNEMVGRLVFVANAKQYPVNVAFITIYTANNEGKYPKIGHRPGKELKDGFKKYMAQAYIQINEVYDHLTLDLTTQPEGAIRKIKVRNRSGKIEEKSYYMVNYKTEMHEEELKMQEGKPLFNHLFMDPYRGNVAWEKDKGRSFYSSAFDFLDEQLYLQHPDKSNLLRQCQRIYLIDESDTESAIGRASFIDNQLILFHGGFTPTTLAHEFGHRLGLQESHYTENNQDLYKFVKNETDNIMAYQQLSADTKSYNSFFYWQIKKMQQNYRYKK